MKLDKTMLGMLAGVSLFIGFVIFSVAVGAVFPSIHKLTAPLICRGEVQVESIKYYPSSGGVGWKNHIYCMEQEQQKEITFQAIGVTGLLASAIIFGLLVFRIRKSIPLPDHFGELAADLKFENKNKGSALERMSELKKMRDENLISTVEYERKKADIMKEL